MTQYTGRRGRAPADPSERLEEHDQLLLALLDGLSKRTAERDAAVLRLAEAEARLSVATDQLSALTRQLATGHVREVFLQDQIRSLAAELAVGDRELAQLRGAAGTRSVRSAHRLALAGPTP
jgi:hypothetical protein